MARDGYQQKKKYRYSQKTALPNALGVISTNNNKKKKKNTSIERRGGDIKLNCGGGFFVRVAKCAAKQHKWL